MIGGRIGGGMGRVGVKGLGSGGNEAAEKAPVASCLRQAGRGELFFVSGGCYCDAAGII